MAGGVVAGGVVAGGVVAGGVVSAGGVVAGGVSGVGAPPQATNKQEETMAKPVDTKANFFIGDLKKIESRWVTKLRTNRP